MIREITEKVEDFEGEGVSNIFQNKQNVVGFNWFANLLKLNLIG